MWRALTIWHHRAFWIGLICGAIAGGVLVWRLDRRSLPSMDLEDARRAGQFGKWDLVQGILGRYLRRFPEDPEAQILVARAQAAQGNLSGCLARLGTISESSDWSGEARLCEAQALLLSYFGLRAERSFQRAIELDQGGRGNERILNAARVGLAQLYALEVRPDEAREQLMQALKSTSDPAAILSVLLEIQAIGPEPHGAIDSLERFIQNDPADIEARRALGHHYMVLGRLEDARRLLESCVREQPLNLRAAESLAHCLIDLPDLQACNELLEAAAPGADQKAWYWRLRGYLREQEQDWTDAAQCYERAVRLAPKDPVIHHLLATVLNRQEQTDQAAGHLERESILHTTHENLLHLYPKLLDTGVRTGGPGPDPDLCYLIGTCCRSLGLPEAEGWFREAVARDPSHTPSLTALEQFDSREPIRASTEDQSGTP